MVRYLEALDRREEDVVRPPETPERPSGQPMSSASLLALQRTAGNRAVASAIAGRSSGRRTLLRWIDLGTIEAPVADQRTWELFVIAQKILLKQGLVRETLKELQALADKSSLSEALAQGERGGFAPEVPKLIGFVPPAAFNAILRAGQQFEDLVAPNHGRKSHRIQWHVLARHLPGGLEDAVHLYKQAADPAWDAVIAGSLTANLQGKHIWDLIVDVAPEFEDPTFDLFISPDKIQAELMSGDYGKMTEEANQEHARLNDDRAYWATMRPQALEDFSSNAKLMSLAKRVSALQATNPVFTDDGAQAAFIGADVMERVSLNGYEWTGWLPAPVEPFLLATVAYPPAKKGPPITKKKEDCVVM